MNYLKIKAHFFYSKLTRFHLLIHTLDPCNQVSVISYNVDVIFLVNLLNIIVIASAILLRHDATLSLTICALSDMNMAEL